MGIKGIYKEIGPGRRISLSALSLTTLESCSPDKSRPFRLAIDISIWQFQVLAARGGSNPAIRTLFYRLVRLLTLAIHPIFVFDGPQKPLFKRNKRSVPRGGATVATAMAKRMIRLFGFAIHDAPGEAEAECALLQKMGVVDAVLSEDVDTIMFGCGMTLKNWTAEGKGSGPPTHVSVYEADEIAKGESGLDREGMVLVALMSGGDYIPEGVPGCGVKVACEAARAGFGKELCKIKKADAKGLEEWKERLLRELKTNESGYFRTKHKALEIPEDFPNMEVLRYYTHPVVSKESTVERLKREFPRRGAVDVIGLREFVGETFDWSFLGGAIKLTRVLAPGLLVHYLLESYASDKDYGDDLDLRRNDEAALVRSITSKRAHASTDATPELRISFVPLDIVKLDLSKEPVEEVEEAGRTGLATNSDDEFDDEAGEEGEGPKKTAKKPFDPAKPDLVWIPETLAKLGIPLTVEEWEGKQRAKEIKAASKGVKGNRLKNTGMQAGALDSYVTVSKAVVVEKEPTPTTIAQSQGPPRHKATKKPTAPKVKQPKKSSAKSIPPAADINPWTFSSSQVSSKVTKTFTSSQHQPILISSSPVAPSPPRATVMRTQSTPTRPQRSADDDPSFSSPIQCPLPTTRKSESPPAGSQARPFKRTKSGAETFPSSVAVPLRAQKQNKTQPKPTAKTQQQSIKSFGRTVKSATTMTIPSQSTKSCPIEFLSSDSDPEDDDDDEFPDLNRLSRPKAFAPVVTAKPPALPSTRGPLLATTTRQNTAPPPSRLGSEQFKSLSAEERPASIPLLFSSQPSRIASNKKLTLESSEEDVDEDDSFADCLFPNQIKKKEEISVPLLRAERRPLSIFDDDDDIFGISDQEIIKESSSATLRPGGGGGGGHGSINLPVGNNNKKWRMSEVECVDLTGDD
ncbi:hypothetical protein QBC42DRAFT_340870 [Cladorrhinum samala]|uniref:Flap structure-specific endonuclease n=1 Tax=Cladorrhinum samala TaxID=585594 RepID=A0AAV9HES5_9PEZI|nr:hypothetical protein QBC42DRAFT_340870 [Cladorrhinum samala]